jgi:glycosyltransferase involved in cell wall biosynthesis
MDNMSVPTSCAARKSNHPGPEGQRTPLNSSGAGGKQAPFISLIVSTYNRPRELWCVLRSLSHQRGRDFEVIVADDGSGEETAGVVGEWHKRWNGRLEHVWHEDRGFRLAEIRNRAIAASRGDYIVFLDGDCIPPRDFVDRHARLAQRRWMVCGNRLMLGEALSHAVLREQWAIEEWTLRDWLGQFRRGGIARLQPLLRLPDGPWRRLTTKGRPNKVRGCNMAVWRDDLLNVDGFDADFVGWGHEDNDLASRLELNGVKLKDGRWATGVFHLWHKPADRANEEQHWAWIAQARATGRITPRRGLSSLRA